MDTQLIVCEVLWILLSLYASHLLVVVYVRLSCVLVIRSLCSVVRTRPSPVK